jgi:hypothetical protein
VVGSLRRAALAALIAGFLIIVKALLHRENAPSPQRPKPVWPRDNTSDLTGATGALERRLWRHPDPRRSHEQYAAEQ